MSINKRIVGLALFCAAGAAWTTASVAAVKPPVREVLSDSVIPLHYELALEPDAETLTFRAKVAITLDVHVETSAITLNAVGLSFDHAVIDGGKEATVSTDEKLGRATLKLGAPLATGRHVLSIDYHGKIGRSTLGFFAMDYAGPDGPRRTLATNFEPAAARELSPTTRALRSSPCSTPMSAATSFAKACAATCALMPTATPWTPICGG